MGNGTVGHHYIVDGRSEDSDTDSPLAHRAAASGQTDILTQAIKADPTVLEQQDAGGRYILLGGHIDTQATNISYSQ